MVQCLWVLYIGARCLTFSGLIHAFGMAFKKLVSSLSPRHFIVTKLQLVWPPPHCCARNSPASKMLVQVILSLANCTHMCTCIRIWEQVAVDIWNASFCFCWRVFSCFVTPCANLITITATMEQYLVFSIWYIVIYQKVKKEIWTWTCNPTRGGYDFKFGAAYIQITSTTHYLISSTTESVYKCLIRIHMPTLFSILVNLLRMNPSSIFTLIISEIRMSSWLTSFTDN